MTEQEMFQLLHDRFTAIAQTHGLLQTPVRITSKALTPQEAIGHTERQDYPILTGREVMLQAVCGSSIGQAFTDAPAAFQGTLADVLALDLKQNPYARGLFVATMNAVMGHLDLSRGSIHCKNNGPELCALEVAAFLKKTYGTPKVSLIGYQPAMFARLAEAFPLKVLDLDAKNIGQERFGVTIGHGFEDFEDAVAWADVVLCTGSTLCNGSLVRYLDLGKPTWFYGTTLAGAAEILGLNRLCFCETVSQSTQ